MKWTKNNYDEEKLLHLRDIVCAEFNVKWEDVTRHFQLKPLTKLNDAKHTFMYIAHRHLKYTCEQIAKMCNRHHATVLSACKKIDGFYQVGDDVISKIEAIKTKLHEAETN